jgi:teichuronic acid exporter
MEPDSGLREGGSPPARGLGSDVRRSVFWSMLGRGGIFVFRLGGTIVLARLLLPEDYGIYSIALIFTGLAMKFGGFGFNLALIQRKEIRPEHISTLLSATVAIYWSMTLGLFLLAPLVGAWFKAPPAGEVLRLLSLMFLALPFSSVAVALLRRRMAFKTEAVIDLIDVAGALGLSIALAAGGQGAWSLAWGSLFGSFLGAVLKMSCSGWRPSLRYSHAAMKDLYSFGLKMFTKNLLVYGAERIDYVLIALRLGETLLGFYDKALSLVNILIRELSLKVTAVLFTAYSKMQDDRERLLAAYRKVLFSISLVAYPMFAGIFLVAPSFVRSFLGEKWAASIVPLQILSLAGILRLDLQLASTLINAMGKVGGEIWMRSVNLVLLAVACWVGSRWGVVGVAVGVTIVNSALEAAMLRYLCKLLGIGWREFLRPQATALLCTSAMVAAVLVFQSAAAGVLGEHSFAMFFASIGVGTASYAAGLLLLRPRAIGSLLGEVISDLPPLLRVKR